METERGENDKLKCLLMVACSCLQVTMGSLSVRLSQAGGEADLIVLGGFHDNLVLLCCDFFFLSNLVCFN